jgi:5-methylcytosine-specific restriction endonuclease McrA
MTAKRRARILRLRGAVCAHPDCDRTDGLEIDHIVPLELGGTEDDENMEPLCAEHHREKTRADVKRIAKARRIRKREAGEERRKAKIPVRAFPKIKRAMPSRPFPRKTEK